MLLLFVMISSRCQLCLNQSRDPLKIAAIMETGVVECYEIAARQGNKETLDLVTKGNAVVVASGKEKESQQKWIDL